MMRFSSLVRTTFWILLVTGVTAEAWTGARMRKTSRRTSPTFVQEAGTVWNTSTNPLTTPTFNVQAGDLLVAYAGAENAYPDTLLISGGSLTWTKQREVSIDDTWPLMYIWTAVVDVDKTMSVSVADFAVMNNISTGVNVLTFRNASVGASAVANVNNSAPSVNITTTQDNSAIVVFSVDWNPIDGASRTWRTNVGAFTEKTYFYESSHYTVYGGYHADAGPAGTYAVGLSAPAGQKYGIIAVEVKGP